MLVEQWGTRSVTTSTPNGSHVPFWTDDMHIGLTLADLTKVPLSALVAGGRDKLPAIAGALRGAFFNVLVTDAETARALIGEPA